MISSPAKLGREKYEIGRAISCLCEFNQLLDPKLIQNIEHSDRPDVKVDLGYHGVVGIEVTSVYMDSKSVPTRHYKASCLDIYDDDAAKSKYKNNVVKAIHNKIAKARSYVSDIDVYVLYLYLNEYIDMHIPENEWAVCVRGLNSGKFSLIILDRRNSFMLLDVTSNIIHNLKGI